MSIEQIWCAGHNTVFTKLKYSCEYRANLVCWSQYCFYKIEYSCEYIEQIWCAGHNTVFTMYMYTTQEYLAHHTRIYLPKWNLCPHQSGISVHTKVESVSTPKWNQCPHQSGISVHTKVESVSTPKWNQCPHQNGISTPPECNVYTITKFKQYTIILTLISLHRMYLAINKDHFDRKGRPMMELGGGESIKCIMEGNYIRILSPEQGYFGLNERSETAVFVKDKSGEDESLCLQFEWHEIPREEYISDRNLKQQPKYFEQGPPPPPINKPNVNKLKLDPTDSS